MQKRYKLARDIKAKTRKNKPGVKQGLAVLLCNVPKVYDCGHNSQPLDPVLGQVTLGAMECSTVGKRCRLSAPLIADLHGSEDGDSQFPLKTPFSVAVYHRRFVVTYYIHLHDKCEDEGQLVSAILVSFKYSANSNIERPRRSKSTRLV
jgi:hypothetical protein